jgi:integrase
VKVTRSEITKLVKQVRDGKPPKCESEEVFWHPGLDGFGVRLLYTGRASWILQYKLHGRTKRLTLADVREMDEPLALNTAKDLRAKMRLALLDPMAARVEARRTAKITFSRVAESYLADAARKLRVGTIEASSRYLTGYYYKTLHKLPFDEITHEQINLCLREIERRSGDRAAAAAVSPLKSMFKWAIKGNMHPGPSPMLKVNEPVAGEARDRVLSPEEIKTIWLACDAWEADVLADEERERKTGRRIQAGKPSITDYARVTQLMFLTGCRVQEIGDLEWKEIDRRHNELDIPASRIKTDAPLHLPLVHTALDILAKVEKNPRPGEKFVFGTMPGKGFDAGGLNRKINRRIAQAGVPTINPETEQLVREMLANGVPTYRIRREAHVNWNRVKEIRARMQAGLPIPDKHKPQVLERWTSHDIRRTVRTELSGLGCPRDIAERILNHVGMITAEEAVYDRHTYRQQKRYWLSRWEEHLLAIVYGRAEKIVPMPRKANEG